MLKHQRLEIWQPKYSTNEVLISIKKAAKIWGLPDIFELTFTKAKHLEGNKYLIPGKIIRSYPIQSNGKIRVYRVPFNVVEQYAVQQEQYQQETSDGQEEHTTTREQAKNN